MTIFHVREVARLYLEHVDICVGVGGHRTGGRCGESDYDGPQATQLGMVRRLGAGQSLRLVTGTVEATRLLCNSNRAKLAGLGNEYD